MTITFQSLINVADELSRKKLITNFNLRHLDGQASVNQLLKFGYKFLNRITKEAALKLKQANDDFRKNGIVPHTYLKLSEVSY
jgi:hypothetical protein